MKDSEDDTSPSVEAAWVHLMAAIEAWEGEIWRSQVPTAGWALNLSEQARSRLEQSKRRLLSGSSYSRKFVPAPKPDQG